MDVATAVAFAFVFGVFFGTLLDRLMRKFYAWLDKRTGEKDND